jgi:hypothetical protein
MKMNRLLFVSAVLWLAATAPTFADNPHLGTWKLDESKSTFAPGSTKNHTVTYTEAKDDMITLTVDGTDKDGKPVHWTWTGKFDGKPYKVEGSPVVDSIATEPVNKRTNSTTGTKDGKVVFTGTIKVAKDGKSRVVKTTLSDADGSKYTDKAYYDKQ